MSKPNATLLRLLAACAEGDPRAARDCALDLAVACSKHHAPNIVFTDDVPPSRVAYMIEDRKDGES